jgi:hypothetical protein
MSKNKSMKLPSKVQIKDVVKVDFENGAPMTATVVAVHFYEGKIKYDLNLWIGDYSTRIYNIDSCYVKNG